MFNLTNPLLYWHPWVWLLTILVAVGVVLGAISVAVARGDFQESQRLNLWLTMTFVLICLWLIKGQVMNNFYFHLVGASVALLVLGVPLALLALACTTLIAGLTVHTSPWIWGMQYLLAGALPVAIAAILHGLVKKRLSHRLFVYIFIRGFFVAALGMMLTMMVNLMLIGHLFAFISMSGNQMAWISPILLGWGEGFLSGAAIALIVVYQPDWLYRNPPFTGI